MRLITCLFIAFNLCARGPVPPGQPLVLLAARILSGAGLWQRSALDDEAGRLYVPGPGGVVVMDLEGRRVGEVSGIRDARSVALAPELGIGICSSGRTSTLSVFNLASLEVEKELRTTGGDPGAVVFDPANRRIFAFNARGRNATAFDAFGGAVAGSIPLGGRPGTAVTDGRGHVFVSLVDTREVLVLDTWKLTVLRRLPVAAMDEPSGLALDPVRRRLFLVGANRMLAVLDSDSGALRETLPIGPEADGAVCDPATGVAFVPNRDGTVTVVRPDPDGAYRVAATLPALGAGPLRPGNPDPSGVMDTPPPAVF